MAGAFRGLYTPGFSRHTSWISDGLGSAMPKQRLVDSKFLLIAGILLIAANMRPALTSVGPLLDAVCRTLGLTATTAGVVNTLPLAACALVGFFAHYANKIGMEKSLFAALVALAAGTLIRSAGSAAAFFLGTALLGAGIGVCNVLLPSLIKRDFPRHVNLLVPAIVIMMGAVASTASAIVAPLSKALSGDWRIPLGIWGIGALLAIALWIPQMRAAACSAGRFDSGAPAEPVCELPLNGRTAVWRSPLAWEVTAFMGMQLMNFYVTVAWFPLVLQSRGMSPESSGVMITVFQLVAMGIGFVMPLLINRGKDQRLISLVFSLALVIGVAGLALVPNAALLWLVLAGLGSGGSVILAFSFISLRADNHLQATVLSGMSQSIGYLIGAVGPILFGVLFDVTGGWSVSLFALAGAAVIQTWFGLRAGRAVTLFQDFRA